MNNDEWKEKQMEVLGELILLQQDLMRELQSNIRLHERKIHDDRYHYQMAKRQMEFYENKLKNITTTK